jgi:hypothetical protein
MEGVRMWCLEGEIERRVYESVIGRRDRYID